MGGTVRNILCALATIMLWGCAARDGAPVVESGIAKPHATMEAPPRERHEPTVAAPVVTAPAAEGAPADTAPAARAPAAEAPPAVAAPKFVSPFPGVRVCVSTATVEVDAVRCLDVGWLEQVACAPGTREHESLVVVEDAKPSHIHAALLMAGFEPGAPGQWVYHDEEERIEVRPPTGDALRIAMRYEKAGETIEVPVRMWIRDHLGEQTFPDEPWVFAGSLFAPNPEFMGPGEHYVADQTGSIIGLVTFGEELIAYSKVLADQVEVQPAEWEVDSDAAPPVGTRVVIVITAWEETLKR